MTAPTVFISYSHDSQEHADRVLELSDRLRAEGWPRWMDKHIRAADFVMMICTATYFHRVMGEEAPGVGQGVRWEGNLIYQHIYNADTMNTKFIPVLFDDCLPEHIPTPLRGATHYRLPQQYEDLYRRLTNQPLIQKQELGTLRQLPPRERRPDYLDIKVSLAKLPQTSSDLFGREKELAALDTAWADSHTNILTLTRCVGRRGQDSARGQLAIAAATRQLSRRRARLRLVVL